MLIACVVGVVTKLVANLPYTIALTLVGLGIGIFNLGPDISETGFGHDFVFFVLLPPLLFQGALHLQIGRLFQHFWPIVIYSSVGVLISTFAIGAMVYWVGGLDSVLIALLFGAMLSPSTPRTDRICGVTLMVLTRRS